MVLFQVVIMIMKTQEKINWANRMEDISMPSSAFFVKLNRPILLEDSLQIDHNFKNNNVKLNSDKGKERNISIVFSKYLRNNFVPGFYRELLRIQMQLINSKSLSRQLKI